MAATGVTLAPVTLVFFDVYSMNGFEMLLWLAIAAVLLLLVEREEPRLWLAFGALSGIALLNKHTVVLVAFALLVGLALSPRRRLLWSPWLLGGGALALVLFLPNLGWQVANGFPSLEFYRNAALFKNRALPPLHVVWNQILVMNPVSLPLWGAGLYYAARRETLRPFFWAYGVLLATVVLSASSRPDRIAGVYPLFFAAGAVFWETKFLTRGRAMALAALLAGDLLLLPVFVPVLPPARVARYVAFLGLTFRSRAERESEPRFPNGSPVDSAGRRCRTACSRSTKASRPRKERPRPSSLRATGTRARSSSQVQPFRPSFPRTIATSFGAASTWTDSAEAPSSCWASIRPMSLPGSIVSSA